MEHTIKYLIDSYSEYLKKQNITEKQVEKKLNKFKIDLVDKYANENFYIVDQETMVNVDKFLKELNSDTMIINKVDFNNFIKNRKVQNLNYKYFKNFSQPISEKI